KIVIVGAGIAGLTLAYLLSQEKDNEIILVEKEQTVGGLARSFQYDDFIFDIGPHRFHTDFPDVINFIKEILNDDYIIIERKSGARMFDEYLDWPLKINAVFKLPIHVLFSLGKDLFRQKEQKNNSFQKYILSHYGKTLYHIFFKPYTEKFLKVSCSQISKDWAITGIERAIIDKNIRMDDLLKLAKSTIFPQPPLKFIYPKRKGIGLFAEKLAEKISSKGAKIIPGSKIENIEVKYNKIENITINNKTYRCDMLFWTGTILEILKRLNKDIPDIKYLNLILYNYLINNPPLLDYQWCYYGDKETPFNRISIPSLFNSSNAPKGKSGICAEVTCYKDDSFWKNPVSLENNIRNNLIKNLILKDGKDIIDVKIETIENAYPIYTLNYKKEIMAAKESLKTFKNLKLLGRTANFWYNNMDHSIQSAINLFKNI
ncbi:MAG: FAD-dependent oxidoreductase, partial [Actinomycetia bacterium]|nr:FAD-dependent oxidoreductase [Actinomycetes bacterium]